MYLIFYFDQDTNDWWPDNFMEPCGFDEASDLLTALVKHELVGFNSTIRRV